MSNFYRPRVDGQKDKGRSSGSSWTNRLQRERDPKNRNEQPEERVLFSKNRNVLLQNRDLFAKDYRSIGSNPIPKEQEDRNSFSKTRNDFQQVPSSLQKNDMNPDDRSLHSNKDQTNKFKEFRDLFHRDPSDSRTNQDSFQSDREIQPKKCDSFSTIRCDFPETNQKNHDIDNRNIDRRFRNGSVLEGEKQISIRQTNLGPGTIGDPIELLSNFYRLTTSDKMILHYNIEIKEKDQKERTNNLKFLQKFSHQLLTAWTMNNPKVFERIHYIYDGWQNLFTPQLLDLNEIVEDFLFDLDGQPKVFTIRIRKFSRIDSGVILKYFQNQTDQIPSKIYTILEVLWKNICAKKFERFQQKYFDTESSIDPQSIICNDSRRHRQRIVQFVSGFASAFRVAEFGLAMNLHLKTTCTISNTLVDLKELILVYTGTKNPELLLNNRGALNSVNRIIRNLKVFTDHCGGKQTYYVEKIENFTPFQKTFNSMTIAEYFYKKYQIKVQNYPLVKTMGKITKHLPLELCYLVKKQFLSSNKLEDLDITKELLMKSTKKPEKYFDDLQSYTNKIIDTDMELCKAFGITFDKKPIRFHGRILPQPKQFNSDRLDDFYYTPQEKLRWAIFSFDIKIDETKLYYFAQDMLGVCERFGMNFSQEPEKCKTVKVYDHQEILDFMKQEIYTLLPINIVFVVLPNPNQNLLKPTEVYNMIKAFGDRSEENLERNIGGFGFVTQCIRSKYLTQRLPKLYFETIALKINGKVGGVNTIIDPEEIKSRTGLNIASTMVIGIDVNHPNIEEKTQTSIAAAVGSLDDKFSRYTASIRAQPKDKYEIIEQLDSMIDELIKEYKKYNLQQVPETLVVFRDGVSHCEFDFIKDKELPKIQKAAERFSKNIKIILLVVQKRHHTRFISIHGQGSFPNKHNVPSGTVVDSSIVDPKYDQFYINSHFAPLGTSRPTKYVLLRNDCRLNADQLQSLCFYMCFNCVRIRGVIAIPTPIRYADLCAYRSKLHIEAQFKIQSNSLGFKKRDDFTETLINQLNQWVKIHDFVKNYLYYC